MQYVILETSLEKIPKMSNTESHKQSFMVLHKFTLIVQNNSEFPILIPYQYKLPVGAWHLNINLKQFVDKKTSH